MGRLCLLAKMTAAAHHNLSSGYLLRFIRPVGTS